MDESVGAEHERKRSRWVAELEIGIVGRIFQVPKTEVGKTLADQEAELSATCAAFVASKMQELPNMRNPALTLADILRIAANIKEKYSSSFWQAIVKLLEDPSLESATDINGKQDKKKPKGDHTLVPKVLKLDADGRPIAGHETVTKSKGQTTVENIPWDVWLLKEIEPNGGNSFRRASSLFWMTHESVHSSWDTACPITIVRKNNSAKVVTLIDIRARELVLPLFVKRPTSVVAGHDNTQHQHAVPVIVSWPKHEKKKEENEEAEVEKNGKQKDKDKDVEEVVRLMIQPEVRLPETDADGSKLKWKQSDCAHPFWVMKRASEDNQEEAECINAEIICQEATHLTSCGLWDLNSIVLEVPAITNTYKVSFPFIVNTQPIEAGKEVVLKWNTATKKKSNKREREQTAFDQIKAAEKRAKTCLPTVVGPLL